MFLVTQLHAGPEWDDTQPLKGQTGWDEHAAFMNGLEGRGFVVLGGPLADDDHRVVLAIDAVSEDVVRTVLARDPWSGSHLVLDSVEPWTILLDGR